MRPDGEGTGLFPIFYELYKWLSDYPPETQ